jgi:enterochelin esterase family protein
MKTKYLIICCLLITLNRLSSQTFESFINELNLLPTDQRQAVVDSFVNVIPHSPFTESDTLSHFFYTGNVQNVSVPGDATGWDPGEDIMIHIDGTNFWYFTAVYENDARLDYKYVTNGSNWILDPRNPNSVTGGFGPNSELAMPAYVQPPEIEYDPVISHGSIFDTLFFSADLGNSRHVKVFTPPSYEQEQKDYPVVLFHDGPDFLNLGDAKNVLDYMISNDLIEPVIGIFVPAVNRSEEYHGNLKDEYTEFIVTEVMGWVDNKYRTLTDPQFRATAGVSDGGNISLWIGMNHPETFGNIAAYSSNVISQISSTFENSPALDLDIYLDIGKYDISELIPMVHNFREILENKGYHYLFYEWHEGHSWGNWRAHIDNALQFFFPYNNSIVDLNIDSPIKLSQNYPNPASTKTTISFSGQIGSEAELSLLDETGKTVSIIWAGKLAQETNRVEIEVSRLKSGIYFYKFETELKTVVRKLVVQ